MHMSFARVQILPVPCDMEGQATNIMWDVADPNVFVIAEQQALHVMLYVPVSISGAQLLGLTCCFLTVVKDWPIVL
jgi:hypothetical protein